MLGRRGSQGVGWREDSKKSDAPDIIKNDSRAAGKGGSEPSIVGDKDKKPDRSQIQKRLSDKHDDRKGRILRKADKKIGSKI